VCSPPSPCVSRLNKSKITGGLLRTPQNRTHHGELPLCLQVASGSSLVAGDGFQERSYPYGDFPLTNRRPASDVKRSGASFFVMDFALLYSRWCLRCPVPVQLCKEFPWSLTSPSSWSLRRRRFSYIAVKFPACPTLAFFEEE